MPASLVLPSQITGLLSGGLINPAVAPCPGDLRDVHRREPGGDAGAHRAEGRRRGPIGHEHDVHPERYRSDAALKLDAARHASELGAQRGGKTGVVTLVSADITDAVSTNTASRLVLRDGSGNFSGTISAALSGNASTATALFNTRTIWGQSFNGTADITGPIVATGATISGAINGTAQIRTTGAATSDVASSIALQYAAGFGRVLVDGPDASTNGSFVVTLARSDGSSPIAAIVATPTMLTVGLATTAVQALTGTTGAFTAGITQFGEDTAFIIDAAAGNSRLGLVKRSGLAPCLAFRTDNFVINRVTSGSLVSGAQSAVMSLSVTDGSAVFGGSVQVQGGPIAGGLNLSFAWDATLGGQIQTFSSKPLNINPLGNAVNVGGDLAINTNKFTVAASTGNTVVAGTFSVGGGGISSSGGLTVTAGGIVTAGGANITGGVTLPSYGAGGGVVTVGAADSGGAGFKVLRVPN
jgi:hypothetical protein